MPRRPNTEQRRAQIVAALGQVMARAGYAGATVQAVAAQCGLAPGLIHYHFRDKREILVALVESLATLARERYRQRAAAADDAGGHLRAYVEARLAYGADAAPDAVAAWVAVAAEAVRDPDVREVYRRVLADELKLVRRLLRAVARERGVALRRAEQLAAGLVAFAEGACVLATNARDLVPRGFAAPQALAWIEGALAAAPRSAA